MFTGIVEDTGIIAGVRSLAQGCALVVRPSELAVQSLRLGDSVAVSGVCLTVTQVIDGAFVVEVSGETLRCTTLGCFVEGTNVNLEQSVTPQSRLGGHLVTGHVDGVGKVTDVVEQGIGRCITIEVPLSLSRYIAPKGSICVDGVSLTVNAVDQQSFTVMIIPHTASVTTIGNLQPGTPVNLEVDIVARYLERLLDARSVQPPASGGITMNLLRDSGFA